MRKALGDHFHDIDVILTISRSLRGDTIKIGITTVPALININEINICNGSPRSSDSRHGNASWFAFNNSNENSIRYK